MALQSLTERPGLPELVLTHGDARLRVSLQGAHITEYSVAGHDLLWMSQSAKYQVGQSIRGGIPLCWPWFGASLDDASWPQHGFARTRQFRLASQSVEPDCTSVILVMDDESPVADWQGAAALEVEIRLSDHLWMEARTTNQSSASILVGAGLHSYFQVSHRTNAAIPAVTGLQYLDKTMNYAARTQEPGLVIEGEIDRVYVAPPEVTELIDTGSSKQVEITAWGNTDLVIWNPGPEVAAAMADFHDTGFDDMVCIEPAIALDRRVKLEPGESHAIGQTIRCSDI